MEDYFQRGCKAAEINPNLDSIQIGQLAVATVSDGVLFPVFMNREQAEQFLAQACDFIDGYYSRMGIVVEAGSTTVRELDDEKGARQ